MEIITKIIEEMVIKVSPDQEDTAIMFLKNLGFSITNFDHREEYTKVVGQKTYNPKKN